MNEKEKLIQELMRSGYLKTPQIIEAFRNIDRADFVLPEYASQAYENHPLPIGAGQTISQPLTVAFMLELLRLKPGERILDIGSGSGWQAALLASIVGDAGHVTGVERIQELCDFASENISKYPDSQKRTSLFCQDAAASLPEGDFDKIIVAASATIAIPDFWRDRLLVGGSMVTPVGNSIWRYTRVSETEWKQEEFPGFVFVPLVQNKNQKIKEKNGGKKNFQNFFILYPFVFIFAGSLVLAYEIYLPHTNYRGTKTVEIASGTGSRKIGEFLKQEGVIRSKWALVLYASLRGEASLLKPGVYTFDEMPISSIARVLVKGNANEITITVPEGWSVRDIAEYLHNQRISTKEEFTRAVGDTAGETFIKQFNFLQDKPKDIGLEGYLFPDTYRVFQDKPIEDMLVKMLENFDKKLSTEFRSEIRQQKKTIFEIVTMASLIEREVISDEDRALVSGILWKRLGAGIPLQVDATVLYARAQSAKREAQNNNNQITREDKKNDSPYNTYFYRGLPKGPIANPGLSALRAALYPKTSPYLYYLSTPDGKTIFSRTLEEHNEARAKYLTR